MTRGDPSQRTPFPTRKQAMRYLLMGLGVWALCLLSIMIYYPLTALVPFILLISLFTPPSGNSTTHKALSTLRSVANMERRRAGTLLGQPISEPYLTRENAEGTWLTIVLKDPATWRDLAWYLLHLCLALPLGIGAILLLVSAPYGAALPVVHLLRPQDLQGVVFDGIPLDTTWGPWAAVPAGVLNGLLGWWLLPRLALVEARIARWLLAPARKVLLAKRIERLTDTRSDAVDDRATELRRIERDLHDGAQARLVALAMNLGMAQQTIQEDPEAAAKLLAEAQGSASTALTELRSLVQGICPPVLAERGLLDALRALALQSPVPTAAHLADIPRQPAAVESALYFVAAEALANIAKHANATQAAVRLEHGSGALCLEITDNGRGGADADRGTGIAGIARRMAAFDGALSVTSPVGGPTTVQVELPCAS